MARKTPKPVSALPEAAAVVGAPLPTLTAEEMRLRRRRQVSPTPADGPRRQTRGENRTTVIAKDAYTQAFADLGGVAALVAWARENQTEFYKLHARLIPLQHQGTVKAAIAWALPASALEAALQPPPALAAPMVQQALSTALEASYEAVERRDEEDGK